MTIERALLITMALVLITISYICYLVVVGTDGAILAGVVGVMAGLAGFQAGRTIK